MVLFGVVRGNPVVRCRDRDVERTEAEMGVEAGKRSSLSLSLDSSAKGAAMQIRSCGGSTATESCR